MSPGQFRKVFLNGVNFSSSLYLLRVGAFLVVKECFTTRLQTTKFNFLHK